MPKRVLIADDTELYRTMLSDILSEAGHEVVGAATNGREAFIMASTLKPDIIFLDIIMPEMNGLEAAREISASGLESKIIMCSSLGNEAIVDEAVRAGASGYVLKPIDKEKVLKAIELAAGDSTGTEGA